MTSPKLPITINAEQALMDHLGLSKSMLEKLEAWANFSTLKANWYGDVNRPITLQITIVAPVFFQQHFINQSKADWCVDSVNLTALSSSENKLKHSLIISLSPQETASEHKAKWVESDAQLMLQQQLHLFLNTLAEKLDLDPIIN